MLGNVFCTYRSYCLTDEALHPAAIGQLHRADPQRRRNLGDKRTEALQRHVPQLQRQRSPTSATRTIPGLGGVVPGSAKRRYAGALCASAMKRALRVVS